MSARDIVLALQPDHATTRTVRRDLEVLRDVGVPIRTVDSGKKSRYAAFSDGPFMRLDCNSLLALRLALGLMLPYRGTAIGEALEQLTRRLESAVPNASYSHFAPLVSGIAVRAMAAPRFGPAEGVFGTLRNALAEGRCVEIEYADIDDRVTVRTVHPQQLIHGPRGLYLLAFDASREMAARTFRIERIRRALRLAEPSQSRPGFESEEFLSGSLGVYSPEHEPLQYRFLVHSARAHRLLAENPLHQSQSLVHEGDDRWSMTLELRSSAELLPQVLAMGSDLEVIAPHDFRQTVIGSLLASQLRYSDRQDPAGEPGEPPGPLILKSATSRSQSVPDVG